MIKKCKCGSQDFLITETLIHEAVLDEEEELTIHGHPDGGIDSVHCRQCGREHSDINFRQINF